MPVSRLGHNVLSILDSVDAMMWAGEQIGDLSGDDWDAVVDRVLDMAEAFVNRTLGTLDRTDG